MSLAFGPEFVIGEEFGILGALAVAIYGSWAARYAGTARPAPNDVDVLVIGDVPAAICTRRPSAPSSASAFR